MDNERWLQKLIVKIETLKTGEQFEVKDLFKGITWEKFSKGERISFGRYFSNEVNDGRISNVKKIGKAKNNHTKYEKK